MLDGFIADLELLFSHYSFVFDKTRGEENGDHGVDDAYTYIWFLSFIEVVENNCQDEGDGHDGSSR